MRFHPSPLLLMNRKQAGARADIETVPKAKYLLPARGEHSFRRLRRHLPEGGNYSRRRATSRREASDRRSPLGGSPPPGRSHPPRRGG